MLRPLLLALFVAPLASGCAAVAAAGLVGVGALAFERNELERDYPASLQETWQGSLDGLRNIGIYPTLAELGATEGRIEYRDLCVLVERHPEGFTRVRVRVGTFYTADHRRRAALISQEIEAAMHGVDDVRSWGERVKELRDEGAEKPPQGLSGSAPAEAEFGGDGA
jgi:hypothetical protein